MSDRQLARWQNARREHHAALQALRLAQDAHDRAAAEMATAASALVERVRIGTAPLHPLHECSAGPTHHERNPR